MINYSGFPVLELNAHHSRTSVNKLGENLTLEWQTLKKMIEHINFGKCIIIFCYCYYFMLSKKQVNAERLL